jgi:flagellar biosynthesis/type III secretory pathway protein FliH
VDAGARAAAKLLVEAAICADEYVKARETELIDLAFAIAHRIIADLSPDEALMRAAQTAFAEHRRGSLLTIRVAPNSAGALRAALVEHQASAQIEVEIDPGLAPGSCILVHDKGRSSIGIIDQFRALLRDMPAP